MDERRWTQTAAGGVFIALGVLLLGTQADWWSLGAILRWWPVGLLVAGVARGIRTPDGFVWIGYGVLLLLWTAGGLSWRESWPLLLVLHGLALMFWPSGHARSRRDTSRVN